MYTTSVRVLRAELATAIRRAQAGESTVVTVSGRPAARLGPVADDRPTPSSTITLDHLVASGAVIAAPRGDMWRPGDAIPIWPGTRIDQALREVR